MVLVHFCLWYAHLHRDQKYVYGHYQSPFIDDWIIQYSLFTQDCHVPLQPITPDKNLLQSP